MDDLTRSNTKKEEVLYIVISKNDQNKQLPNELKSTFKELNVLKHLRNSDHPLTNHSCFLKNSKSVRVIALLCWEQSYGI